MLWYPQLSSSWTLFAVMYAQSLGLLQFGSMMDHGRACVCRALSFCERVSILLEHPRISTTACSECGRQPREHRILPRDGSPAVHLRELRLGQKKYLMQFARRLSIKGRGRFEWEDEQQRMEDMMKWLLAGPQARQRDSGTCPSCRGMTKSMHVCARFHILIPAGRQVEPASCERSLAHTFVK